MGLLFTDGFDSFGNSAGLLQKWGNAASPWTWGAGFGRNGGPGVKALGNVAAVPLQTLNLLGAGVTTGSFVVGFYVKCSAIPSVNAPLLQLYMQTNGLSNFLNVDSVTGVIHMLSPIDGVNRGTGAKNIADNNWHWIEVKFVVDNATTLWQVYVDTVLDISVNVAAGFGLLAFMGGIAIASNTRGMDVSVDDVIFYDNNSPGITAGSSFPIGQAEITTLRPNSDQSVQFTPKSAGTNFSQVNEVAGDGDGSYVESATSGNTDYYGYTSLSGNPASIFGVMLNSYLEDPNAGTFNFEMTCKSGGTVSTQASTQLPTSYFVKQWAINQDPHISAAWTQTTLNAANFGIKVP